MKLIYKGEFDGNQESLPHGEHMPGAVPFKEIDSPQKLGVVANGIALVITILFLILFFWRGGMKAFSIPAVLLVLITALPHELLHAICFKEEVYLYKNLKNGMLFVVGTESMSKTRFVMMSLLPNLVFGILPFLVFLIWPKFGFLGTLGAFATGMGAGDYYNIYNALRQMPKGARTYLYQFHSYWYLPEGNAKEGF